MLGFRSRAVKRVSGRGSSDSPVAHGHAREGASATGWNPVGIPATNTVAADSQHVWGGIGAMATRRWYHSLYWTIASSFAVLVVVVLVGQSLVVSAMLARAGSPFGPG